MKLLKYNPDAKCSKCGHEDVNTIYHDENICSYSCSRFCTEILEVEHFSRCCLRCHYSWSEGVLK